MTTYIGIDPGTNCGWAVLADDGTRIASGVWDMSSGRHEGGGMRYLRARRHMWDLLNSRLGDVVVAYEEVSRHRGVAAAHVYGGIVAQVTAVCEERGVAYSGRPVGSVKKHATGKGNASKGAMVYAAIARWGGTPTDDEADALWIADHLRLEMETP